MLLLSQMQATETMNIYNFSYQNQLILLDLPLLSFSVIIVENKFNDITIHEDRKTHENTAGYGIWILKMKLQGTCFRNMIMMSSKINITSVMDQLRFQHVDFC